MAEPRELTEEEVRSNVLEHIWHLIHYWHNQGQTKQECLEGLAFSVLVMLDGGTGLPGFIVAPRPHEDDKPYSIEHGEDYYPENHEIEPQINADIAGCLHEHFYGHSARK